MHEFFRKPAVAVALALSGIGAARADGPYAGGSLGGPDYHNSVNGIDGSGGGVAGKIFGGYQINPYFAVEAGGFSLGHLQDSQGKVDLRGIYVDAVGSYEFAPRWSLTGRGGLAEGRFTSTSGNDSSPAVKLGVGIEYALTNQTALLAEYERYHFADAFDAKVNAGMYSLGVKFGF
jgi:OOP family OmpA-OmpF porin